MSLFGLFHLRNCDALLGDDVFACDSDNLQGFVNALLAGLRNNQSLRLDILAELGSVVASLLSDLFAVHFMPIAVSLVARVTNSDHLAFANGFVFNGHGFSLRRYIFRSVAIHAHLD